jgi:hypothetical protein
MSPVLVGELAPDQDCFIGFACIDVDQVLKKWGGSDRNLRFRYKGKGIGHWERLLVSMMLFYRSNGNAPFKDRLSLKFRKCNGKSVQFVAFFPLCLTPTSNCTPGLQVN